MELLVLLTVTFGVIGLAGRLPEARQVKRELARRRLDAISSLADGKEVTLRGYVRSAGTELTAPQTGEVCVFWRRGREERGVPFELETETGRVRVVPISPGLGVAGDIVRVDALVTIRGVCTLEPDPTRSDADGLYRGGKRPMRPVVSGSRKVKLLIG